MGNGYTFMVVILSIRLSTHLPRPKGENGQKYLPIAPKARCLSCEMFTDFFVYATPILSRIIAMAEARCCIMHHDDSAPLQAH